MKRWILLLCCILLALSVTGCTGENSSSDSSSEQSSSQTQLQEDPVDPETAAALELVAEADCEVPDFLTEEQQTLYRKAYTAYKQFALYTDGFGSTEYNPVTVEEYDTAIDYIVTPTKIMETRHEYPRPAKGIIWMYRKITDELGNGDLWQKDIFIS